MLNGGPTWSGADDEWEADVLWRADVERVADMEWSIKRAGICGCFPLLLPKSVKIEESKNPNRRVRPENSCEVKR